MIWVDKLVIWGSGKIERWEREQLRCVANDMNRWDIFPSLLIGTTRRTSIYIYVLLLATFWQYSVAWEKMHFTWFSRRYGVFSHSSGNPALAATRLWAGYGELVGENSISPGKPCKMHFVIVKWCNITIYNSIKCVYVPRVFSLTHPPSCKLISYLQLRYVIQRIWWHKYVYVWTGLVNSNNNVIQRIWWHKYVYVWTGLVNSNTIEVEICIISSTVIIVQHVCMHTCFPGVWHTQIILKAFYTFKS